MSDPSYMTEKETDYWAQKCEERCVARAKAACCAFWQYHGMSFTDADWDKLDSADRNAWIAAADATDRVRQDRSNSDSRGPSGRNKL